MNDSEEPKGGIVFGRVLWWKKDVKCCACKQGVENIQKDDLCRRCERLVERYGE